VIPGILRLAQEPQPYRLAISLHAANQSERQALVPSAQRWPLDELIEACRTYCAQTRRRIFFEWTLIEDTNDSSGHAVEVATLLRGIDAHVNLIPLNPTSGFAGAASERASEFQRVLREAGVPSTVRQRRGIDVAAGCGQLRADRLSR
jgi:23S rRNA (adenine2503-C2)-methyltransferase